MILRKIKASLQKSSNMNMSYSNLSRGRFQPAVAPTAPIIDRTLSTKAFARPCPRLAFPLSPAPELMPPANDGPSLPIVGRTLSLADKLTKSANGTNHTQSPKYDAISVKVGMLLGES
jgi:hypothetical protein